MNTHAFLPRILLRAAVLGLAGASLAAPALAEELARLTVELRVKGTEQVLPVGQSRDHAEGRFDDAYRFVVTAASSGELNNVNVKDPGYAEQMMARALAIQQQVMRAQAGQPVEELEENDDYRYLDYYPSPECRAEIHVRIERALSGEFDDVQGLVPYSVRHTADYAGSDLERQMMCFIASLVLDVEAQVFYTDGLGMPEAQGLQQREVRGRPAESAEARLTVQEEVALWVTEQLRKAPVTGRRQARIPLLQDRSGSMSHGEYGGEAEAELSWALERL